MKIRKISRLRWFTALAFIVLAAAGMAWHTGWGTLSSFGWKSIAAVCPLGGLETLIAGHSLTLRAAVGLVIVLALVALFGRIFCGWMCPTPLIRKTFGAKDDRLPRREGAGRVIPIYPEKAAAKASSRIPKNTPLYILVGALGSTAVFGFPVFCLICPVGLTFGVVIGAWRLFQFNIGDWSILLFVALLALELFALRRWCASFCPLGALMSLLSRANRTFRPVIDESKCLRAKGLDCNVCRSACPEGIDLTKPATAEELARCTKCHACSDACAEGAISFPLFSRAGACASGLKPAAAAAAPAAPAPAAPAPEAAASQAKEEPQRPFALKEALLESRRCIMCGECERVCPMGNPIPEWMEKLREGRPREAARLMLGPGSMPEICSRVCPTERLCERSCSRAEHGDAIQIHLIERAVADAALKRGDLPRRIRKNGRRAAVVGAGPAGLACADVLAHAGFAVTVYDKNAQCGGLLFYGIPAFKLERGLVLARRRALEALGVVFRLGTAVGKDVGWKKLLDENDAVFAACGAEKSVALDVPNAGAEGVSPAIGFLREAARAAAEEPGAKAPLCRGLRVLVLGGGDTAVDCAERALELGAASVTLAYRGEETKMRASRSGVLRLKERGVKFLFGASPAAVLAPEGRAAGVSFADRREEPADLVLAAFGFRAAPVPELQALGARFDARGRLVTGRDSARTDISRLYAGGDAVRGAALVVEAVSDGRRAGLEIERDLGKSRP
ncbi:FAD-dependent oxidoreductase [Mesosutterella sp. AGMB02718]|uniref:FAD-dependent oxidoreductase n=1 Tax=Mesosutterella faecium TaxID=2925194 RepID=A0ABT7IPC0_9BURK|nr:FAD-dependent oxidoreductase [Mesosutterella sp. AGMB02718]MDL2060214.1 FAD-dependent oxidoreductase [Mesosutterella sp. AGMB02718]